MILSTELRKHRPATWSWWVLTGHVDAPHYRGTVRKQYRWLRMAGVTESHAREAVVTLLFAGNLLNARPASARRSHDRLVLSA